MLTLAGASGTTPTAFHLRIRRNTSHRVRQPPAITGEADAQAGDAAHSLLASRVAASILAKLQAATIICSAPAAQICLLTDRPSAMPHYCIPSTYSTACHSLDPALDGIKTDGVPDLKMHTEERTKSLLTIYLAYVHLSPRLASLHWRYPGSTTRRLQSPTSLPAGSHEGRRPPSPKAGGAGKNGQRKGTRLSKTKR